MRRNSYPQSLLWVIALAALLRIVSLFILPSRLADDSYWYLRRGELMVTNTITMSDLITFGPGYAVVAGFSKAILGHNTSEVFWDSLTGDRSIHPTIVVGIDATITALRLLQALLGTLTCALIWKIAYHLTGDTWVATVAGMGITLNPIFIIESNSITSETLFIFLMVWGLSIYIGSTTKGFKALSGTGILLGMATLTRAMLLLYPFGLVIHLVVRCGWKRAIHGTATLLLVYAAVVSTWTIYNLTKFNRLVIGADGMSDFLLMSVTGFQGMHDVDKTFAGQNNGVVPTDQQRTELATQAVSNTIRSNPLGYAISRFKQLTEAALQPHQTTYFGGESLKVLLVNWLRQDRSVAGLQGVINGDAFWPKLSLYIAHYLCLIFGAIGIILTLHRWRTFAPLSGLILYTLLLHFVLLANPRYLFPIIPLLWVFAGVALVYLRDKCRVRYNQFARRFQQLQNV